MSSVRKYRAERFFAYPQWRQQMNEDTCVVNMVTMSQIKVPNKMFSLAINHIDENLFENTL